MMGSYSYNEKNLCIWSLAKVIRDIRCNKEFDCYSCSLDKALNKIANLNRELRKQGIVPKGKKGQIDHWKEKLLGIESNKRPCIYSMKNKIPFRSCINEYDCGRCEFNQYFEDVYSVYTEIKPIREMDIKGFRFPHGYYLSKYHTWIKIGDSSTAIIGMDDFVHRIFGPFEEIRPPVLGKRIKKGKEDVFIKKGKGRDGYLCSPVNGIVIDVNPKIWKDGYQSNQDPYTNGWIIKVQVENLIEDIKDLFFEEDIPKFLSKEVNLFYTEVEKICGPMTTDGGMLVEDIFNHIPELDWKDLSKKFLRYND